MKEQGSFSQLRQEVRMQAPKSKRPEVPLFSEKIYPDPYVTTFYFGAVGPDNRNVLTPLGFAVRARRRSAIASGVTTTIVDLQAPSQLEIKIAPNEFEGNVDRGIRQKFVVRGISLADILQGLQTEEGVKELFVEFYPKNERIASLIQQFRENHSDGNTPILPFGAIQYTRREFVHPDPDIAARLTIDSDISSWEVFKVSQNGIHMLMLDELPYTILELKQNSESDEVLVALLSTSDTTLTDGSKFTFLQESLQRQRKKQ